MKFCYSAAEGNVFMKFCYSAAEGNVFMKFCYSAAEGNVFMKFCYSAAEGNVFIKFCFHNSVLGVMLWRSSASATPLRRECIAKFHFSNQTIKGSLFTIFPNSALEVIS